MPKRKALIIGAGPAGLTAAYELMTRTDIEPVVFEMDDIVGGIARTVNYKGNLIDIGGHRFFSKDDDVMDWWQKILPVQGLHTVRDRRGNLVEISYQNKTRWLELPEDGPDPEKVDDVMLVRARLSRILFLGKLFDYPISISLDTLAKLGLVRTVKIGISYLRACLFPIKPEDTLEVFFINRFGRELYETFFKDYTHKVWGIPCSGIPAVWGAQRIKGISIASVIKHALKSLVPASGRRSRKETETSLIEQFLYPKLGVGQMWERTANLLADQGHPVRFHKRVVGLTHDNQKIVSAQVEDVSTGAIETISADYFFSTMPVRHLIGGMEPPAPEDVREVADGLLYRDFMTVGLLLKRVKLNGGASAENLAEVLPDNWMYVQEHHVKVGRVQFFNNWSPYMVVDPDTIWIGLEYFVNESDELWNMDDEDIAKLAIDESEQIGLIDRNDVLDQTIIRIPKAYPAYFGTYDRIDEIKMFTDSFENLFLVGRNGMHLYNNQDHSMLAAICAVDNILSGESSKKNIWRVNPEGEYQESK